MVDIRFAKYDDFEGIMALYELLAPEDTLPAADILRPLWDEIVHQSGTYRYGVAEAEGQLVSTANIVIVPNLTHKGRPYAVIENVITHPVARRKGFGRAVIQLLLDFAREKNCYKVMLLSGSHRKEAHVFYKSMGFNGDIKRGFTFDMK